MRMDVYSGFCKRVSGRTPPQQPDRLEAGRPAPPLFPHPSPSLPCMRLASASLSVRQRLRYCRLFTPRSSSARRAFSSVPMASSPWTALNVSPDELRLDVTLPTGQTFRRVARLASCQRRRGSLSAAGARLAEKSTQAWLAHASSCSARRQMTSSSASCASQTLRARRRM